MVIRHARIVTPRCELRAALVWSSWSLTIERRLLDWPAYSDRLLCPVRAATCFNGLPVCMPQHAPDEPWCSKQVELMRRGETRRFLVGAGCSTTPDWRRRGALDPVGDRITSRSRRRLVA
jgi:hypothetical protein